MTRQHGMTLWELLITLLLVSTGVVGTVSLQLYVVQQGRLAYQSTQATLAILALSEQLRTTDSINPAWWQKTATAAFPDADMTICTDSTPDDGTQATDAACDEQGIVQIAKVWWHHHLSLNTTEPRSYLPFRLTL